MSISNKTQNSSPLHFSEIWFYKGSLMNCVGENLPKAFSDLEETHERVLDLTESDLGLIRHKYWFTSLASTIDLLGLGQEISHNTLRTGDVIYFPLNKEAYMLFGLQFRQLF